MMVMEDLVGSLFESLQLLLFLVEAFLHPFIIGLQKLGYLLEPVFGNINDNKAQLGDIQNPLAKVFPHSFLKILWAIRFKDWLLDSRKLFAEFLVP